MKDENGIEYSLSDGCYHSTVRHYAEDDNGRTVQCQNECWRDLRHITERKPHRCMCGKTWTDSQTTSGQIRNR